jgi:hypothetical protein
MLSSRMVAGGWGWLGVVGGGWGLQREMNKVCRYT